MPLKEIELRAKHNDLDTHKVLDADYSFFENPNDIRELGRLKNKSSSKNVNKKEIIKASNEKQTIGEIMKEASKI